MRLRSVLGASSIAAFAALAAVGCASSVPGGFGEPGAEDSGAPAARGSEDAGAGGVDARGDTGPGRDASAPATDSSSPGQGSSDASPAQPDAGPADVVAPPVDTSPPSDGFDAFQHRNLDDVNMYRATKNLPPLVLDKTLCTFALAGSQQLSQDHTPHQHFIDASNNGTLFSSGFTSTAEENQGDPNGWNQLAADPTQNELDQIDAIQKAMFDEGPGDGEAHGHYENMMNSAVTRLGVGLLEVQGQLYLTNDFSD